MTENTFFARGYFEAESSEFAEEQQARGVQPLKIGEDTIRWAFAKSQRKTG